MKKFFFASIAITAMFFTSCKKETTTVTVDPTKPDGAFTVSKTGSLVAQNGTPTQGTIEFMHAYRQSGENNPRLGAVRIIGQAREMSKSSQVINERTDNRPCKKSSALKECPIPSPMVNPSWKMSSLRFLPANTSVCWDTMAQVRRH